MILAGDRAEYDTRQEAVHRNIDVIGIHPRLDGVHRVMVVSCKNWQSGFRPEYWIDTVAENKVASGREALRKHIDRPQPERLRQRDFYIG